MIIPKTVTVAARVARLGRHERTFSYRSRISEWFIFSFLLFTTSTCWAEALVATHELETSRLMVVGIAIFVSSVTLGQFVQLQVRRRKRIFVYANGLVMLNGFGRIKHIFSWKDVAMLRQKHREDMYLPSMETPFIEGSHRAWLTLRDGTRVRFSGSIQDSPALMKILSENNNML